MHLNVPPPRESKLQYWVRTIKWALLGVFGPELVLFVAWKQYLSAKAVVERTRKPSDKKDNNSQRAVDGKQVFTVTIILEKPRANCRLRLNRKPQKSPPLTPTIYRPLGR